MITYIWLVRSLDISIMETVIIFIQVGLVTGHQQEVCGLAWSPDGRTLASGGKENILNKKESFSCLLSYLQVTTTS